MIGSMGAQLYRDADAMLARRVSTGDLPGAAVDVTVAGALGGLGAALLGVEQTLDRSLLDVFA